MEVFHLFGGGLGLQSQSGGFTVVQNAESHFAELGISYFSEHMGLSQSLPCRLGHIFNLGEPCLWPNQSCQSVCCPL